MWTLSLANPAAERDASPPRHQHHHLCSALPILDAVHVIVTGDKHFRTLDMEAPRILTARAFIEAYGEAI